MKKKSLVLITAFVLALIMSGCCLKHDWQDATCTSPKTCAKCGETEGEALGHNWTDATCTEPKTCTVCKETEGEALGHNLTEVNYQQASTCITCGTTMGEPLEADFVKYGLTDKLIELNKVYDYITCTYDDHSKTTVGKVIFSNYRVIPSSEKEGYEWRMVDYNMMFGDQNARDYGFYSYSRLEDFYNIVGHDESSVSIDDETFTFTVNFNGIDYTECLFKRVGSNSGWSNAPKAEYNWGNSLEINATVAYFVPIGYDGMVFGFANGQVYDELPKGAYLFEFDNKDSLFFRFE